MFASYRFVTFFIKNFAPNQIIEMDAVPNQIIKMDAAPNQIIKMDAVPN